MFYSDWNLPVKLILIRLRPRLEYICVELALSILQSTYGADFSQTGAYIWSWF